jgi:hypothetical protein
VGCSAAKELLVEGHNAASWAAILNDLRNYVRRTLKFSWATSSRVFRNEPEP